MILGKPEIMMCVMAGDASLRDRFQLFVLRCRMHHEWGVQLLKDISVRFQEKSKEFVDIVRYQIEVDRFFLGNLHGGADRAQPKHFIYWQDMNTPQVIVRIRRRKPVEMRSADRCEQERIGVFFDRKQQLFVHAFTPPTAERRAFMSKLFAAA